MTSGERMVWAVVVGIALERNAIRDMRPRAMDALIRATEAVKALRACAKAGSNDEDVTAMLRDMLSTGADR